MKKSMNDPVLNSVDLIDEHYRESLTKAKQESYSIFDPNERQYDMNNPRNFIPVNFTEDDPICLNNPSRTDQGSHHNLHPVGEVRSGNLLGWSDGKRIEIDFYDELEPEKLFTLCILERKGFTHVGWLANQNKTVFKRTNFD